MHNWKCHLSFTNEPQDVEDYFAYLTYIEVYFFIWDKKKYALFARIWEFRECARARRNFNIVRAIDVRGAFSAYGFFTFWEVGFFQNNYVGFGVAGWTWSPFIRWIRMHSAPISAKHMHIFVFILKMIRISIYRLWIRKILTSENYVYTNEFCYWVIKSKNTNI